MPRPKWLHLSCYQEPTIWFLTNSYQILIKYKILNHNYLISELNLFPIEFDIEIPDSSLTAVITLYYYIA